MPGYLQELQSKKNLSNAEQAWLWNRIKQRVAPYILRRTKAHVLPELPEKIEQVIYYELEPKQEKLYLERTEKTHKTIFDMQMANASEAKVRIAVFKQLMELRQTCVDPTS